MAAEVDDFAFVNPHLTLSVGWFGERNRVKATTKAWKKWLPSDPTSAHWYERGQFERLITGYITHDQDRGTDRLVRDFVREFRGYLLTPYGT